MKDTQKKYFKITFSGIMIALMFALSWTVLGMVPLGTASATTVFIPVVIGIICLDDFRYTSVLGISFGVASLIRATVPSGILDPYFLNPLVSVLPRFAMAILAHLCYRGLNKVIKKKTLCAPLVGALAALFNTVLTIGTLLLVYYNEITVLLVEAGNTVQTLIGSIALLNMLPEIALGAIVSFAVMAIYERYTV